MEIQKAEVIMNRLDRLVQTQPTEQNIHSLFNDLTYLRAIASDPDVPQEIASNLHECLSQVALILREEKARLRPQADLFVIPGANLQ